MNNIKGKMIIMTLFSLLIINSLINNLNLIAADTPEPGKPNGIVIIV